MLLQLYLHFPFCKRKCFYCDFCSAPADAGTVAAYCSALKKEICLTAEKYPGAKVSTVFLGGGTPTLVPGAQMRGVLEKLRRCFDLLPDAEITAEGNPGTLSPQWLEAACACGLNRLSLGMQAAQDRLLHAVGRIHTFAQAREAVTMARSFGIRNLSVDLMSGLPGQTLEDWRGSIEAAAALGVEHVSAYSLILEEGTPLWRMVEGGSVRLPDEELAAEMYERGVTWLEAAGYARYEISNYARPGFRCRHNMGYWQGSWYAGLGVTAHGMLPPDASQAAQGAVRIRRANTERLPDYLHALGAENRLPPAEITAVDRREAMFETMMLGLRMTDGVAERDFERLHGKALLQVYGPALDALVREGLGAWSSGAAGERRFFLTPRGLEVQNEALMALMP